MGLVRSRGERMRKSSLILFVLIAVFSVVTFVACNTDVVPVRSVTLTIDSTHMKVGENKTLYATVRPADAVDTSVTWTSSDEDVATVDQNGKVTAGATGTAIITVTSNFDNTKKATCTVNVYDPYSIPLTLELIEDGDFTLTIKKYETSNVYYSYNGGPLQNTGASVLLKDCSAGDTIALYRDGEAAPPITIRCSSDCYVYGNVMSLIDSENYATKKDVPEGAFMSLFKYNDRISSHPDLDLVLPATELAARCYDSMFYGCPGLKRAPELPATTLAASCYANMFYFCTGLTKAPELPATTLADYCYDSMFHSCSSLTKAPELPATTLEEYCYHRMFDDCTALKDAPLLPAKTLVEYCYEEMFEGCVNITSITCLATDVSAEGCTDYWVYGLHDQGTFYKDPSMDWDTGYSKVPAGWKIVDYSAK